ncbi:MAG: hypothetical protein ACP6IU_07135 [Candidatus Asgardarchaeia archaeon]
MRLIQQTQRAHKILEKIEFLLDRGYSVDEVEDTLLKEYDISSLIRALIFLSNRG